MKMKLSDKYGYLLKNTMLFTIANFSNKLIVFFLLPFYTAFLTTEEYAVIDLISITQQLIFPIVTLDITEAVIRFGMQKKSDKKIIFTFGLLFVVLGNILLGLGCFGAQKIQILEKNYLLYFFIFSFVISANTLFSSFLRTIDKIEIITIASVVNTFFTMTLNILLIGKLKMGINGYYISYIIGNFIAIMIMIFCINPFKYITKINKKSIANYLLPMIKYSIPLMPNALFWWVNNSLDRYFLTALGTLSSVGLYAAANKIPSVLSTFTSIFQQSWGLSMFKENESSDKKKFFSNVLTLYNTFILLITIILIIFSRLIASLLLSKDFYSAWTWIPWLVLGFYSNSISTFLGTEFTASKKTMWALSTTLISAFVNICFNIFLIPEFSGLGAAIATCISYIVLLEIRVYVLNKYFEFELDNKKYVYLHIVLVLLILSVTCNAGLISYALILTLLVVLSISLTKEIKIIINMIKRNKKGILK